MVCEQALAAIAEKLNLGRHLLLGNGEEQTGGRNRASILADAVESVIAASFLDGGMVAAKAFIEKFVLCDVQPEQKRNVDYKTALQEHVQKKKDQVLTYVLLGESGPDHAKLFQVAVNLNGKQIGTGAGITALCGITEPGVYGVLFPNRYPLIGAMIGGGVGGFIAGLFGLTQFVVANPGFLSFAAYMNPDGTWGNFWGMMGVMVLAVVLGFVCTYVLGKRQMAKKNA
jgi:hypothetical protein